MEKIYLNYQFQKATGPNNTTQTMVFIHGLFGDLNNLGVIARAFADKYHILRVDLRNHGQSFHTDEMNYQEMAEDLQKLLTHLSIQNAILVGHSMGGKTAMALADLAPNLVEKLVVIDIAPVAYQLNRHDSIFTGLFAVKSAKPENRQSAKIEIAKGIKDEGIQQFMLKSFDPTSPESFKFNLSSLHRNYANLMGWQSVSVNKPTLFIKGELSDYLQEKDTKTVLDQFPQAKLFVVSNADHWVHAEKPDAVIRAIQKFLN
ncbi:alpha/beta fold hydrolase [Ursidibacter maritimus]|uniref:Alpha/beta fold hydrolase n=1 Tax=Ursidibacter maritimus TaxID=1331689 RepID=A0A949WPE7_9PAST|nr:alpha/beta fold hydrolase [Ursidibacter maritimus]KAE9538244.1 acyl-CoA esterase [Ursidibacter maritimus]MBV6523880.1 alpha/beta fold hydrolase [Ursidibacter maritimus]MBV6526268.1 alpha/beta fold hydrolase [Ursidibacter maritimus]MBV6527702.1 alpha/beta fold hydrolase [Ursidibacter maritimus]MBV6529537.1 alpha/beta fold hydrolase [Ursidibacter maritimus]